MYHDKQSFPNIINTSICFTPKGLFSPVGMENNDIPDHNIMDEIHEGRKHFRLNLPYQPKFIASSYTEASDYFVRITFGYIPFMVTGIAMHGRNIHNHYVISYVLSLSRDLGEWCDYVEDGETKVSGNIVCRLVIKK